MGFLIFAYRKLFLKRRINDLQFKEMSLQQKKMNATEQIGNYQTAVSYYNNIFQAGFQGQIGALMQKYPQYQTDQNMNSLFRQEYTTANAAFQQQKARQEYQEQAQMQQLKNMDTQIEQQMASIESQLKLMNAELESVEKGEDQAAKQDAPKFGLS